MSISPGTCFGPYEVAESIGAGGMGEVYRARDTNLKRDVALKVLPAAFVQDADRLARFQREAEILAALNHPNIAQVYGLEKTDGQTVIVMELIEGPTLAERIEQGPIPPDEAMGIALQVIAALEAAHEKGIVHRDLKPANVKLKDDGTVKVLDFGISKTLDPTEISGSPVMTTPAVTQTGVILGTAAYMSPEQARGRFVDQRTDVWAFGCLLFEMLTGQPAFGGEDVMLTLARVLDRDTDLSSIPKTISPAVRHTLKLCLEKDPRRRIADIRDVRLALDGRFETEYPVEDAAVVAAPFWKRALAPVAALVVGGVIVGAAAWFGLKPEPPRITKFADVLPEGVAFHNVADYNIALSRDGKMIAYGANGAIYVRTLGDLEPRRLDQTAGEAPVHLVFSPDGEWIAYWSPAEGELKKVAVQGGSPVTITRAQANPYGPRWTDDDFIVYGRTGSVVRVPASGGQEPEVLFDAGNTTVVAPFVLPGGQKLLVNDGNGRIIGVNLATGESTPLFMGLQPKYLASGHVVYLDDTSIVARTFDPDTFEFGGPVSLVDDVFRSAGAAAQFEVSPSGTLVYIQGRAIGLEAGGTGLAIVAADGTVEPLDVPIRNYLWPRVSPDGRRLAVQVSDAPDQSDIFIYDLSGQSEMRQLTFEGDNNQSPYWKDADTLLFASNRDGRSLIYEQPVAGGRAVPVSDGGPDGDHSAPALTPDGRLTLLAAPASGLPSTWIESDDAFDVLLGGDYLAGVVDFSPDGRAMAYLAQGQSAAEFSIFVEPYPPDGSKRLVSNASELALFPRWVRNGADSPLTLVYQVPTNGAAIAVDVTLPGLELGNRRTLFTYSGDRGTSQIDSIPGSDRFVISWSPGQGGSAADDSALPRRIVVVENWVEELKTRVR